MSIDKRVRHPTMSPLPPSSLSPQPPWRWQGGASPHYLPIFSLQLRWENDKPCQQAYAVHTSCPLTMECSREHSTRELPSLHFCVQLCLAVYKLCAGAKPPAVESANGTPEPEARVGSMGRGESEVPGGAPSEAGGGASAERGGSVAPSDAGIGKKEDPEDEKSAMAAAKERNLKRAETIW